MFHVSSITFACLVGLMVMGCDSDVWEWIVKVDGEEGLSHYIFDSMG